MDKQFFETLCIKRDKYQKLLGAVNFLIDELLLETPELKTDTSQSSFNPPFVDVGNHLLKKEEEITAKQTAEGLDLEFLHNNIEQKVFLSLKEIGKGNINDIYNVWIRREPLINYEFARSKVKQWVHSLASRGEIKVIEKGAGKRSGVYAIIEEDNPDDV